MTLALLRRAWPLLLGGLLLFGAWQLVQSHRAVSEDKGRLEQRIVALREDLAETEAVADVLAEQAHTERAANRTLARQLNDQRERYDQLRHDLRRIVQAAAAGDCLHEPVHPDVGRLLRDAGAPARLDPGMPDPGEPGAP